MHYLGKRVEATATLPDGREEPLLRIDDWDFNWQDEYRYRDPIHLPAGTRLRVRFTFDNSTANPRNPHDPPVTVGFGPQATDEMAELMLQVLPVGDADTLASSLAVKQARDDILGYQSLLRADPADHVNHAALAVRYLDVGQVALAREHLEEAIALAPDFADAHYNLGSVALAEGTRRRPSRPTGAPSRCAPTTRRRTTIWEACWPRAAPWTKRWCTTGSPYASTPATPPPTTTWPTCCWPAAPRRKRSGTTGGRWRRLRTTPRYGAVSSGRWPPRATARRARRLGSLGR